MSASSILDHHHAVRQRLVDGEPLRLLIGERFYGASEITLTAEYQAELRGKLVADFDRRIDELTGSTEPDPPPAAPAAAMPVPQAGGAS